MHIICIEKRINQNLGNQAIASISKSTFQKGLNELSILTQETEFQYPENAEKGQKAWPALYRPLHKVQQSSDLMGSQEN
jgi:hypothetical protein